MDELASALAFDRGVHARGARQATALPEGMVILHPGLPSVHHLNSVLLDAPLGRQVGLSAIVRLADAWLRHLAYRRVVLDDAGAARRLQESFNAAGWTRQRTVFMVWRGARVQPPGADPRVREISEAELHAHQLERFAEERGRPSPYADGLIAALVAAQGRLRAGTPARCFGAGDDGAVRSSCTLFLGEAPLAGGESEGEGRVAMIEEVGTLIAHRERGLARAVVMAAVAAAWRWGAEQIVIPADADDWPQLLYGRLGFAPVGEQVAFTLTRPPSNTRPL